MPAGEINYVNMGNGFTLIKFTNENGLKSCVFFSFINHGLFRGRYSILRDEEGTLTTSNTP